MKRNTITAIFLLLALLFTGCAGGETVTAPPLREPAGMEQDIVAVTRGSIGRVQTFSGLVMPEIRELSFSVAGPITEVLVSVGSQVKSGQPLAKLNTASLESALASARDQLEYSDTEHELNRKKRELQMDIARLELEELKSYGVSSTTRKLKEAQIRELENQMEEFEGLWALNREDMVRRIEELEKQVNAGVLAAPCDGTVVHCAAAEGSYAMANNALIWLAAADTARIRTDYLTAEQVSRATELYAMVDGYRVEVEYVPLARKEYLAMKASGDVMQSTFLVKEANGHPVEAGMEVILFLTTDQVEDALLLPANAVHRDTGGFYVYCVTPEGRERRTVTRGVVTDALVQIDQGLEEGDQVYVGN